MSGPANANGAVRFDRVTKSFVQHAGRKLLRDRIADMVSPSRRRRLEVLKDVSFAVAPGESLGLVGPNGAGKSTLLNLAAGVLEPDSGTIEAGGRVGALLELGAGFHLDLTGAENLRIQAVLMGLSRRETHEKFEEIVEFSGVREFIGEPLRTYSYGMILRLAFAVAVGAAPDVLLIDEMIGVGDQAFQEKAHQKIQELRRAGHTILLASHAEDLIASLCDRAMWLERGRAIKIGTAQEVLAAYRNTATAER
ncbi:MAG TPA: ABC transporter ATP-binding protein [Bryobacteraceae bacterium]|nr:ABC transporter ATP-binding protein [Bryobacteraceae bacterium]